MSAVRVQRIGYAAGAEISGLDASNRLDDWDIAVIREACLEHVMVYIPGQRLDAAQFKAFSERFGELDLINTASLPLHPSFPEIVVRSNRPRMVSGKQIRASLPADKWHIDYSHSPRPATMTFLLGKELPSVGGDTIFSNAYMAYEALSPEYRKMADGISAVHDFTLGAGKYAVATPEEQAKMRAAKPATVHPLVMTHPETGRKGLFLGGFIRTFEGMTPEETKPILDYLMKHATRYEFTYRHRWTENDLVIWDNRCSMHLAVQDYGPETRTLWRCSVIAPKPAAVAATEREEAPLAAASR